MQIKQLHSIGNTPLVYNGSREVQEASLQTMKKGKSLISYIMSKKKHTKKGAGISCNFSNTVHILNGKTKVKEIFSHLLVKSHGYNKVSHP